MKTFTGRWKARVEQDFEIEAETREEAEQELHEEMSPRNVVELIDFEAEWDEADDRPIFTQDEIDVISDALQGKRGNDDRR